MSESEEEYDEFEEQLRLEAEEKERRSKCSDIEHGSTRVDPDGTVYEWDADKMAYFPKIDANFIAQYQMNYGSDQTPEATSEKKSSEQTPATSGGDNMDWSRYFSYVQSYIAEHGKYPKEMTEAHIEYYKYLHNYYYGAESDQKENASTEKKTDGETVSGKEAQENPDESTETGNMSEGKSNEKTVNNEETVRDEKTEKKEETADEKSYREYYEYYKDYYKNYKGQTSSEEGVDSAQKEFDEWAWHNYFYNQEETAEAADEQESEGKDEKKDEKKEKKRKANEQGWFEMESSKNTSVYVSGLPEDVTDEEFKELMSKCGMVMLDPRTHNLKLKLYRDADGKPKGDGLCCYIKPESVELALQMLDDYDVRGYRIAVELAKFEMKGTYDPKRRKKLSSREKKKLKVQQEKLFDWRPDKPKGYRAKHERIIVVKQAFDPKDFENDPAKIQLLREEMRAQCTNFGTVKKVIVYDRNPEAVVTVAFEEVPEADLAKESLHGRFFKRRQIHVETWDGKTKYDVKETDEEKEARLKQWAKYLGEKDGESKLTSGKETAGQKGHTKEGELSKDQETADAKESELHQNSAKDSVKDSAAPVESAMITASSAEVTVESPAVEQLKADTGVTAGEEQSTKAGDNSGEQQNMEELPPDGDAARTQGAEMATTET